MITLKKAITKHLYTILCNGIQVDGPYKKAEAISTAKGYASKYHMQYKGIEGKVKRKPRNPERSLFESKYK